tara:strand:- start:494 stop:658 length:165 start_codon:yes stop_codon:yes gene_type:complete
MNKSLTNIDKITKNKPPIHELKKKPHKSATEIIGVKFGGWGINLDKTKIIIKAN